MKPRPGTAGGCCPSALNESICRLTDGRGRQEKDVKEVGRVKPGREQTLLLLAPVAPRCLTLQALCAGIVHGPADQCHRDAQQHQEDPILPQPGHEEPLDSRNAVCGGPTSQTIILKHTFLHLSFQLLRVTSALGVGAFLLHGGHEVDLVVLLAARLRPHRGLPPVPLPVVRAVLLVATVVAVLAMAAAVAVSRLAVAVRVAAMLLDLSLCQQASGLSPT